MRSYDDRLAALNKRASELKKEQRRKKILAAQAASFCLCLVLLGVLAAYMPGLMAHQSPEEPSTGMNASVFSQSGTLAFVVTGILAFLLGVAVSVFCMYLNRWNKEKNDGNEEKMRKTSHDRDD